MPAKKNQKTNVDEVKNTQEMKSSVETQPVAQPVAQSVVADASVADASVAQPVAPVKKQRGGSKKQAVTTHVVEAVSTPVVEAVVKGKRGGKAKAVATEAPASTAPTSDAPVETKTGGAKSRSRKAKVGVTDATATVPATTDVTPPKRQRKSKKVDETATATGGSVDASEASLALQLDGDDEKHVRSFKVRLPGSENFEGRFTGLTPYQAANKALSKYFRAGDKTHGEVTFSICESTRKSKKSVYTYVGQRHRLADPVKYKIQDGREIVKNFKNSLKKVKKTDTSDVQSVSAPSASA